MVLGLRDIAAESVLIAGGARAILLQLAHPSVGRGVAEHSDFADRPLDRLNATMTYLYAVVYGTDADRAVVRRRVNRAHASVRGPAAGDQPAYDAGDPELQLWVAATLYDTTVQLYERIFGPLEDASAERILREDAVIGTALQVREGDWFADRAGFRRYWDAMGPRLRVSAGARRAAHELLRAEHAPSWVRALMPLIRLITVGLLPAQLREPFGLRLTVRNRRRFDRWMRVLAAVYPRLPRRVRLAPRDVLLTRLRRSPDAVTPPAR